MKKITNRQLFRATQIYLNEQIEISGWIRNHRDQKEFGFIDLNDGSFFKSVQVVYTNELENFLEIKKIRIGASIKVFGTLVLQEGKETFEISASNIELLGDSKENYPIQPKRHTREFLREKAHLRPRTNLFQAVFRVRSLCAHAIHEFFQNKDFVYLTAPIITASDAEGAGEMFQVTNLNLQNIPFKDKEIDYKKDFFGKSAHLTVSGQLSGEAFASAFKDVYTFGPTFRSENSNTQRHAAEFWMIEPEIAFADLDDNMALAEEMVKYIINYVIKNAPEEMNFLNDFVDKTLFEKLDKTVNAEFAKVEFKDAIDILQKSKKDFENKPLITEDLATEHEKYLVEYFGKPVFVINWPKEFKAFYMRLNDDLKTVAAMDLLVQGSGELIGGSQREERLDVLEKRISELKINDEDLWWYKELREYGSVAHAGFGLGFERMVMFITGIDNIRDVTPFPRTPKSCEF